ncbi:MAG: helix-turn-helix transcriptional regulator [Clostridia bacterium]|nr:helix-turn-helix transcriptional regulator [Clostridia bacterium]
MNLGTTIRAARRSKDMTQEDLASLLGVTLSAVSQWEQGKTMPDIALVPGLCSALSLSADTLFGIDPASKEEKIEAVIAEAERMEDRNESPRDVLALLEDALARYPDSMKLTEQTAYVLRVLATGDEASESERKALGDRAAALYEKLLAHSSDEELRQSAKQSLIFHFCERGEFARATEMAETMPTCVISRENLMFTICLWRHDVPLFQYYKQFFLNQALDNMTFNCRDADGNWFYNAGEMAAIHEKRLAVLELLFDGNYLLANGAVCFSHGELAEYRAGRGETEEALSHLVKAADAVLALHEYLAPVVIDRHTVQNGDAIPRFTCLLFRGGQADTMNGAGMDNARRLLGRMAKPVFDPLRARPPFIRAEEKVRAILHE